MLLDARTIPDGAQLETDLCIIGGGPAGITVAHALAGRSTRILLLESGPDEYDDPTQSLYDGESVGLPYYSLKFSRLRFFGGSANHWGGYCMPHQAADFEARTWIPHSGWPIGEMDLAPYYPRAAELVGIDTTRFDLDWWITQDQDRPLPFDAARAVTRVVQIVRQNRRGFRFRDDLQDASNVTLCLRANALEIVTDDQGRTTREVRVGTLEGARFSVAARAFVLATGGIENARLLLASNGQNPAGVGNDHDLVGRFFGEHPRFGAATFVPTDRAIPLGFHFPHRASLSTIEGYIGLPRELQRREELVDVQILMQRELGPSFDDAVDAPVVRDALALPRNLTQGRLDEFGSHLANVVGDLSTFQQFTVPGAPLPIPYPELVGEVLNRNTADRLELIPAIFGDLAGAAYAQLYGAPITTAIFRTRIDQAPNPESRVALGTERDAFGMLRGQLDWQLTDLDRYSVRRTLEIIGAEIGRLGLGRLQITFDADGQAWPEDMSGGYHHAGTTRMSADPRRGVVDGNCRVHGLDNLYIAGSSVFPTVGSGNPTYVLVALALRLADHLGTVLS
ncbi:MAG TPA: GMC family oxidoreductase [Candidatus Limnocylindria bacterium]|nr:GMC family oxidoreductase [Candidatus Limnocylindria bacterium]